MVYSCCCVLQIEKCREWDDWIEKAFAAMDKSGSGRLSRDDLAAYLCKDGMCLSEQALRQALAEAHRACGDNMTLEVCHSFYRSGRLHSCSRIIHQPSGWQPMAVVCCSVVSHMHSLCIVVRMQHTPMCLVPTSSQS
jgi:hypothetical protein